MVCIEFRCRVKRPARLAQHSSPEKHSIGRARLHNLLRLLRLCYQANRGCRHIGLRPNLRSERHLVTRGDRHLLMRSQTT
jgi:hypothetical protein